MRKLVILDIPGIADNILQVKYLKLWVEVVHKYDRDHRVDELNVDEFDGDADKFLGEGQMVFSFD